MDDIVWIREEPPAEEQKPNDALQNDIVIVDHPQDQAPSTAQNGIDSAAADDDEGVEIPVIIEFKSTEVPYYKRTDEQPPAEETPKLESAPPQQPQEEPKKEEESQEGDVVVEVYDPTSTTVPAPQPVAVEVYDPTSTTTPAYMPVGVEVFDPSSTEIPVIIDHTTPEIKDEAAKKLAEQQQEEAKKSEEPKQEQAAKPLETAPVERAKSPESTLSAISEKKEEDGFDISEYERKLNAATEGTKDLVNKLCDKSQELNQTTQSIANDIADQRRYMIEDVHKTIEDIDQMPPPPELPTGGLPKNVESIIIGEGVVKFVTGVIVLPNGTVLATDEQEGLILFDTQGNVLRKVTNVGWKNPRSPIYYKEHILMLIDMQEEKGIWTRYIFKFTIDVEFVARIEGPKWVRNETIISERLSIAHTDYLYLCVCGEIFSALYELTPVGQWTELQYRLSESYIDMLAFAVIGPITQILVVEGRKNYVLQFSVRDSEVVDRRRLAICERPGAMARDEDVSSWPIALQPVSSWSTPYDGLPLVTSRWQTRWYRIFLLLGDF